MQEDNSAEQSGWVYSGGEQDAPRADAQELKTVSWTASEFIAHEKDANWFILLGLSAGVITALTFVVTRDKTSTFVVLLMMMIFTIFANRKPRVLPYRVDSAGIHIGDKTYPYDTLKTFSIIQEGGIRSIMLMPLKRFMPPIGIYMDPSDEEEIINVLSGYLPFEQREQELVDRLMRHLRF